jgi:hypothetical protein
MMMVRDYISFYDHIEHLFWLVSDTARLNSMPKRVNRIGVRAVCTPKSRPGEGCSNERGRMPLQVGWIIVI